MAALTKSEWEIVETALMGIYGSCELTIDGYNIRIEKRMSSATKLVYAIFVNDFIKGEWMSQKTPECLKFFCPKSMSVYGKKHIELCRKSRLFKKEDIVKMEQSKIIYYTPYYASFATLKRILLANNTDFELVK